MNWKMPVELQKAIADGLSGMIVLRLRGSPAAEAVEPLAKVWIAAITSRPIAWDVDQDLPRIHKAFVELAATIDRWPAPADFLASLPPRKQLLSLPRPTDSNMSPKTRQLIDGLLTRLRSRGGEAEEIEG